MAVRRQKCTMSDMKATCYHGQSPRIVLEIRTNSKSNINISATLRLGEITSGSIEDKSQRVSSKIQVYNCLRYSALRQVLKQKMKIVAIFRTKLSYNSPLFFVFSTYFQCLSRFGSNVVRDIRD
jgi:hypothetical protein